MSQLSKIEIFLFCIDLILVRREVYKKSNIESGINGEFSKIVEFDARWGHKFGDIFY